MARIDSMRGHQAGQGRAVLVEIALLDPPGLIVIAADQLLDEGGHSDVDQREQVRRSRVKAVVEIEDPASDVRKGGDHCPGPSPVWGLRQKP
jgi:hypothetical protein